MRLSTLPLRAAIFLLIALSCPVSGALADIPRDTIDRLAQIAVEKAEARHLNAIGKLTNQEYSAQTKTLNTEQATLWQPLRPMLRHTPEEAAEINAATAALTGQTRAKLAIFEPKWKKEEDAYREAEVNRRQEAIRDADRSAKQAAQIQKQRQHLQAQLDKGTIDRAAFDVKDKEALSAIETLRNKNDPTGRPGLYFDERLTYYTSVVERPPTPPATVKTPTPPATVKPPPPRVVYEPPVKKDYTPWYWIGLFDTLSGMSWGEIAVWVIIIWLFLGFIVAVNFPDEQQQPPKPQTSGIHGTADWADHEKTPGAHSNVSRGVTFGKSSQPGLDPNTPGAPITSQPESHTLIIAQTGAGKGTRVIIPTLLRYSSSMLIIDPKGELSAVTARPRKKLGQQIQIINPWGVMKEHYKTLGFDTATFNPLDVLDRDDPNAVSIAHSIASTICPITDPKQAFWQGSAANILAGVLLWLADTPGEQKTLARIREIITLPPKDFRKIIAQMLACSAFQGAVREAVGQASDTSAADTYGGIMYNLQQTTAFISDSQIKTSTSTSSLSMQKLSTGKLTVYLVIPFKLIKTHSTWLRLVIASGMQALITSRERPSGKLNRCMFLIDEFGSIGHIPDVASQLAQMRGYGMDFTLVLQGLNQLKEHYGDARDSILGNCKYKYFCDVNDLESAKYLSETLGKKTVQTVSKSESQGATGDRTTAGQSTSFGETGRALLTPDEIMLLGKNTAILLTPDTRPHYLHPVDYWNLLSAYKHLENSRHKTYWDPTFSYDRNPTINNSTAIETWTQEDFQK